MPLCEVIENILVHNNFTFHLKELKYWFLHLSLCKLFLCRAYHFFRSPNVVKQYELLKCLVLFCFKFFTDRLSHLRRAPAKKQQHNIHLHTHEIAFFLYTQVTTIRFPIEQKKDLSYSNSGFQG